VTVAPPAGHVFHTMNADAPRAATNERMVMSQRVRDTAAS
jgi:hypothetical protein